MPENMSMGPEQPLVPESSQPVDTCRPAVQSCEQTPEEQSRRNPRCTYDRFEIHRIKKDRNNDRKDTLLYTHQALSRDPGTQAFYIVSAPNFIDPGKSGSMAQIRCEVTGITGPCKGRGTHRHGENNRSWVFNRRILTEDLLVQATTVEKLEFYAKSKEVGEQEGFRGAMETFWIPNVRPEVYYIEANYCGSANRAVSISVYPDVQWEIVLKGSFSPLSEPGRESEGVPGIGFQFSIIRTYGSLRSEYGDQLNKILANIGNLVGYLKKIIDYLESKKKRPDARVSTSHMMQTNRQNQTGRNIITGANPETGMANYDDTDQAIANQGRLYDGFTFEWPSVDLTVKFGWSESENVKYSARAEYRYSIEGNITFFKIGFSIELLGPLLNAIPGCGPLLSKLRDLGEDTNILKVCLRAGLREVSLTSTISFKGVYGGSSVLNFGGQLKLEFAIESELSTRFAVDGPFGWNLEFGAGAVGSGTTGFTIEANQNLWKPSDDGLEGVFNVKFDGVVIRGVIYYEYGAASEEQGDGRQDDNRLIRETNENREGARVRGRRERNYSYVLLRPDEEFMTKKFNFSEK